MFRQVAFITFVLAFFIFILSNCTENSTELSEEEIEWYAKRRIRSMRDSIRKVGTEDCTANYSKYLEQKVDSIIVEYLKDNDTTSISTPVE